MAFLFCEINDVTPISARNDETSPSTIYFSFPRDPNFEGDTSVPVLSTFARHYAIHSALYYQFSVPRT